MCVDRRGGIGSSMRVDRRGGTAEREWHQDRSPQSDPETKPNRHTCLRWSLLRLLLSSMSVCVFSCLDGARPPGLFREPDLHGFRREKFALGVCVGDTPAKKRGRETNRFKFDLFLRLARRPRRLPTAAPSAPLSGTPTISARSTTPGAPATAAACATALSWLAAAASEQGAAAAQWPTGATV